jgi:DNA-damage-inducible protein J
MPKTVMVSAQIDPKLKNNVERVFKKLGLTATQAIVLFYKQVDSQNRLPFEVKRPNAITKKHWLMLERGAI